MRVCIALVSFTILFTSLHAQELSVSPRRRSKFRIRPSASAFDQTQPQVAQASVRSESAIGRRRLRTEGGALPRRRGTAAARRRADAAINNRIRITPSSKPRPHTNLISPSNSLPNEVASILSPTSNEVSLPVTDPKVVCYYTNWSQYRSSIGKFLPEQIDPFLCTHIIYAFGWLKKGRLSSFEVNDESKNGKIGFYEQITNLKKKNPKLKVLIALGGWTFGTKRFRDMVKSRFTRQNFIFSAVPFMRKHNFDGLDLDWEYPAGKDDKNNLNLLCKELMEAFTAEAQEEGLPRLLLTAAVAVGPDKVRGGYDIPTLAKYLDFINVMAYDFHGKWENTVGHNAPLYAPSVDSTWRKQLSVSYASQLWNRLGAPKHKLIIGMPTYGRSFTLSKVGRSVVNSPASGGGDAGKYTGEGGFLAYYEICEHLRSGGEYIWHEEMQVPYMVKGKLWVGFDDERAIRNKMQWLKKESYGGAMVWSIDMDDFTGTACGGGMKYPLIKIMREELLGIPREGKDVNWEKITKATIAERATLPPPLKIDALQLIRNHLAKQVRTASESEVIVATPKHAPKVICYYMSWASKRPGAGRFEPENIDPTLCTHIIYAFATLKKHRLAPAQATDVGDGFKPGTFERLNSLKEKNPNLKIMLALGGWTIGTKPFQELVSSPFRMNGFVYDSVEFLRKHQLDGLDIDWEYPRGPDDKANYVKLLQELRIAYEGEAESSGQPRLLLSSAVPASFEAMHAGYDVPEISKYLDFINVMTYDFHGQWEDVVGHNAPLYPLEVASSLEKKHTVDYSIRSWVKEGAPPQKVMVGMPTYGRSFTLAHLDQFDIGSPALGGGTQGRYTQEQGFLSYYEVCDFLFEDNTTLIWDNEQHIPFAYRKDQWVGFDDEKSLIGKAGWLRDLGLGGVMIWSVDLDDFRGNCGGPKFPLINSLKSVLANYSVELTYDGPYENTGTDGGIFTKRDPNEVVCNEVDGHISYHKDVLDCTRYYMCEGERKHHMPCPQNLVFNPEQNVCDWPENVEGCASTQSAKR